MPKKGTIQHIDDGEWQQTHSHQLQRIPKLCEFLLQIMATVEAVDCGKCYKYQAAVQTVLPEGYFKAKQM